MSCAQEERGSAPPRKRIPEHPPRPRGPAEPSAFLQTARRRPEEAVKAFEARCRRAELGELTFEDFVVLDELRKRAELER